MSTYVESLANSLDERWAEIDLLIDQAEINLDHEALHVALCRSLSVLIIANLEGFIKDCVRSILDDVNYAESYRNLPEKIKRTYVSQFIDDSEQRKMKKLMDVFDDLKVKLNSEPFFFDNNNKNPSPFIVDKVCVNFGINNFFLTLSRSKMDQVFSASNSEMNALLEELKSHIITGVNNFPYSLNKELFNLNLIRAKVATSKTLWEEFLDQLLIYRNSIAHGISIERGIPYSELRSTKQKIQILQYSIMFLLCDTVSSQVISINN